MAARNNPRAASINKSVQAFDAAMREAGVNPSDKESFLNWAISSLWDTFKEQRMNQRMVIENEIRKLELRFPDGTVKKEYRSRYQLPIDIIS